MSFIIVLYIMIPIRIDCMKVPGWYEPWNVSAADKWMDAVCHIDQARRPVHRSVKKLGTQWRMVSAYYQLLATCVHPLKNYIYIRDFVGSSPSSPSYISFLSEGWWPSLSRCNQISSGSLQGRPLCSTFEGPGWAGFGQSQSLVRCIAECWPMWKRRSQPLVAAHSGSFSCCARGTKGTRLPE